MPKVVKYGHFVPENMRVILESFRNSDIGLRAASHNFDLPKNTRSAA
jgi:hypothetical protein